MHTPNAPGTARAPCPTGVGCPGVPGPGLTLPNQPCPISFRYSRLCRPRSADLRSCTVTEPVQLPACPPVPLPTHPPAHLPALPQFPAKPCCPHRASRCQALCHPRMLWSIHAQECCIPGILFSRHPPTIRGRVVPVSPNGMAAELAPCPFSSAGCAELSPAQRWHLAPARPPGTVRPLGSPCQGQAAMGPLLVLSAPPTVAILWAGSDTGQEGAPPTFLSHSWACLHGTRTRGCHRSGWPCPVPPRCCSPALGHLSECLETGTRDPCTGGPCSTPQGPQHPPITPCPVMRDPQVQHAGALPHPGLPERPGCLAMGRDTLVRGRT